MIRPSSCSSTEKTSVRTAPNNRRMELIAIGAGGCECFAVRLCSVAKRAEVRRNPPPISRARRRFLSGSTFPGERMRPSSCSSTAKTRLGPLQTTEVWNSSPSAPVDADVLPSVAVALHSVPGAAEPRSMVVSTVISGSWWSICTMTLPVRVGTLRSLLCFHVPEKFGLAGEQIPQAAPEAAPGANPETIVCFIFAA